MTCYLSRTKMLGLFFLGMLMAGVSWYCTTLPGLTPRVAGWVGVIFFGGGTLVSILPRLGSTSARIRIDEEGITHHQWKIGTIHWRDVEQVWIGSVKSSRFLCVRLKDPNMYLNNLGATRSVLVKVNRSVGFGDLQFAFTGLEPGLDEVWLYIAANHTDKVVLKQA